MDVLTVNEADRCVLCLCTNHAGLYDQHSCNKHAHDGCRLLLAQAGTLQPGVACSLHLPLIINTLLLLFLLHLSDHILLFFWVNIEFFSVSFQEELEHLNQASDEINKLELQLDVRQLLFVQH